MADNTGTTRSDSYDEWKEIKGSDLMLKIISGGRDVKQNHETKSNGGDDDYDSDDIGPREINSGDTVLMDLIGRQADHPDHLDGPIFQDVKGWLVTVGEPYCLIRALDDSITNLKEGETALVFLSSNKYYYPGISDGTNYLRTYKDYSLPADSSMIFELTVTKIVMDTSRLRLYHSLCVIT